MRKFLFILILFLLISCISCNMQNNEIDTNPNIDSQNKSNEIPTNNNDTGDIDDDELPMGGSVYNDEKWTYWAFSINGSFLNHFFKNHENEFYEIANILIKTSDFNHGAICEYFGISKDEYIEFWNNEIKKYINDPDLVLCKEYLEFDAIFSDEPDEQLVFIKDDYKWPETRSVICKPDDTQGYRNRYFKIDYRLIDLVGKEKFNEFYEKFKGTVEFNIVNFINYFNINKEIYHETILKTTREYTRFPYNTEYLYGDEAMRELYFKIHPLEK